RLGPDPREVVVELFGRVGHGAEHPEAAGLADGGHHVTAVAEGEDGELGPQEVLDACPQGEGVAPTGASLPCDQLMGTYWVPTRDDVRSPVARAEASPPRVASQPKETDGTPS